MSRDENDQDRDRNGLDWIGQTENSCFDFRGATSPKMVDKKYFHWKWSHFRKISKGRLSFFWSWRYFLYTSRLTKI